MEKLKNDKELAKKNQQKKDSGDNKLKIKPQAILPDDKRKPEPKDTVAN
jgi:hypothetical protein